MTIMTSCLIFSGFLLHFQLKYLQGNIFDLSYYCAASDFTAVLFGSIIYSFLGGLKASYALGFMVSTVGTLGILHRLNDIKDQQHEFENDLNKIFKNKEIEEQLDFYRRMTFLVFLARFGISMAFSSTQIAFMSDDRIFPKEKRTEAVQFISLFAQSFTSLAPLINEIQPEQVPISILIFFMVVSFIVTFILKIPPTSPLANLE